MLARAIIVDGSRSLAGKDQIARGALAKRPMRTASQHPFVDPGLGKDRPDRREMDRVPAMRGASDSAAMAALDELAAPHIDEDRIGAIA